MQSLQLVIVERSFACIFFWFIENTFWGGPHEYFLFLFWCFYSWGNRLLTPMNPIHSTTFKVASWNILKKRKVEDILIENSKKEMKRVTISSLQEKIILLGLFNESFEKFFLRIGHWAYGLLCTFLPKYFFRKKTSLWQFIIWAV